jgi:hypothetical protein
MFHRLSRLVVQFAERMFGVANCLADDFERFSHGFVTVCIWPETNAATRASLVFARIGFVGNRRSSGSMIRPNLSVVIQFFLQAVSVLAGMIFEKSSRPRPPHTRQQSAQLAECFNFRLFTESKDVLKIQAGLESLNSDLDWKQKPGFQGRRFSDNSAVGIFAA